LISRAVAVIVAPTCSEGAGALTTTFVTVVADGALGPSLHAPTSAHIVTIAANEATVFIKARSSSTLVARENGGAHWPAA
jgi:hypothetical protein